MIYRHRWFAILLLLLGPAGCGPADGSHVVRSDSAGVALVESSGPDAPLGVSAVELAELIPPDSGLEAVPWGVAADPSSGRVFAVNWAGERVAVFDAGGEFVAWLGREGGGPGEFRSPSAVAVDRQGVLNVLDAGRGVVSRWSRAGGLLTEDEAPASFWGPGLAVADGGWLFVAARETGQEMRQTLVRYAAGDTTAFRTVTREQVLMELPCIRTAAHRVFAPSVVWASRGDTAYVLEGVGYRIDVVTDSGVEASYRRPLAPIPVTQAMAEARVENGPYGNFMRRCGVAASAVVTAVGHVDAISPVMALSVDPRGRLWVTRTEDGIDPTRIDVLGRDGGYLGTLDAPGVPAAFLSDSVFVAVRRTELGGTRLTLQALRGAGAGMAPGK